MERLPDGRAAYHSCHRALSYYRLFPVLPVRMAVVATHGRTWAQLGEENENAEPDPDPHALIRGNSSARAAGS
jgi:hypothetical protein